MTETLFEIRGEFIISLFLQVANNLRDEDTKINVMVADEKPLSKQLLNC